MAAKGPTRGRPRNPAKRGTGEARRGAGAPAGGSASASKLIDSLIEHQEAWKGETMSRLRALIRQADPSIVEEVKWRKPTNPAGVPVWSHGGIVCTGGFLKGAVRITFFTGSALDGATTLFNAALDGNRMRAVDFREGDEIDETSFKSLIRAAVALNQARR